MHCINLKKCTIRLVLNSNLIFSIDDDQLTYTTYLMHALSPVNRVLYLYSASKTKPSFLFILFFYKSIFSSNILGKGAPFFDGSLCD